MTWDNIQQLIRIVMQVVAGMLISRGVITEEIGATLTGGVISLGNVVWWVFWNRKASAAIKAVAPSQ